MVVGHGGAGAAAAIEAARAGADTLVLGADISLVAPVGGNYQASGTPTVTSDVTIEGGGFIIERAAGAPPFGIFEVTFNGTLSVNQAWVCNGYGYYAGAIFDLGSTTLTNTTLSENTGFGYYGTGAVFSYLGGLSITNSTAVPTTNTGITSRRYQSSRVPVFMRTLPICGRRMGGISRMKSLV